MQESTAAAGDCLPEVIFVLYSSKKAKKALGAWPSGARGERCGGRAHPSGQLHPLPCLEGAYRRYVHGQVDTIEFVDVGDQAADTRMHQSPSTINADWESHN